MNKISKCGRPLKDWNITINYGIKTGYNEAFFISGEKRKELIAEDPKSEELIRPILRGRDIKQFGYEFNDLWLINVHNGIKEKGIPPINIDRYPAIKAHLDKSYAYLASRQDRGDTPYNLRNCVYMEDFSKQKIFYRQVGLEMDACITDKEIFANDKCYMITGEKLEYLVCFLNSKLFNKLLFRDVNTTGGKGKVFLNDISLPKIDDTTEWINICRQKCANPDNTEIDKNIDKMIYKIFNLTPEEVDYIENL